MPLPREFYLQDPFIAARELVGAYLCRHMPDGSFIRARICELELYLESALTMLVRTHTCHTAF